jgi:hypothetical protein
VRGHGLGVFERPAVLQIRRDPCGAESMAADRCFDVRRRAAAARRRIGQWRIAIALVLSRWFSDCTSGHRSWAVDPCRLARLEHPAENLLPLLKLQVEAWMEGRAEHVCQVILRLSNEGL